MQSAVSPARQTNTVPVTSIADAAAAYVGRAVAEMERQFRQEREVREAQFAAKMAELDARLVSVAQVERHVADRLATLKDGADGRDGTDGQDGKDGVSPTAESIAALIRDDAERVAAEVARATLDAWERPKDGRDGQDADPAEVERLVSEAVARIPAPMNGLDGKDGSSVTVEDVAPLIERQIAEAVAVMPPARDGKDGRDGRDGQSIDGVDVDIIDRDTIVLRITMGDIDHAFEIGLPEGVAGKDGIDGKDGRDGSDGKDGASVTVEDVRPLIDEAVAKAVSEIPAPKDGVDGKDGKLPIVKAWEDRVYYEGEVASFDGGVYQAARDTGKAPTHGDWTCIVSKGRDGEDGRSFTVRGTYEADGEYDHLDVVAMNGAAFVARCANPGPCPGEGWQMIAMQGKPGKPGQSVKGDRGPAGPGLQFMAIDDNGLLTVRNADGSTVECDLYPVLSRLG